MAEEDKNIEAQQINENYLIDPIDIYSDENDTAPNQNTIELPETENPLANSETIKSDISTTPAKTPNQVFKSPTADISEIEKAIEQLKETLNGNYEPAIKNLYAVVSAMSDKRTPPQSFTEDRVAFNTNRYFFQDEVSKVSAKIDWS